MKATLIKVRSNHSNIADKYDGIVESMPKVGDNFILWDISEPNKEVRLSDPQWLKTTPITAVVQLSPKVIEFETKNSKYSLELHG